ncbi:MAG: PQQ-binding-like beta-propeller repeat protein [Acidobacteria bacterium]|nr:PQQ-binding-like beta-propeller repeat protein [Acidobacteriota bacterium]
MAYGQPTVAAGRVFVGSANRAVYSLDARTGCIAWKFDTMAPVRAAVTIGGIESRNARSFSSEISELMCTPSMLHRAN